MKSAPDRFKNMSNDAIIHIATYLELDDIFNLCQISKNFNILICNNKSYWINRLKQDWDIIYDPANDKSPKEYMKEIVEQLDYDAIRFRLEESVKQYLKNKNYDMVKATIKYREPDDNDIRFLMISAIMLHNIELLKYLFSLIPLTVQADILKNDNLDYYASGVWDPEGNTEEDLEIMGYINEKGKELKII